MYSVYVIGDTKTDEIIYVGQTSDLRKRKKNHKSTAVCTPDKARIAQAILDRGWVNMEFIECFHAPDLDAALQLENDLIERLRPTYNVDGGEHPRKLASNGFLRFSPAEVKLIKSDDRAYRKIADEYDTTEKCISSIKNSK